MPKKKKYQKKERWKICWQTGKLPGGLVRNIHFHNTKA